LLANCAAGLRRDFDAVKAGLCPWTLTAAAEGRRHSSGPKRRGRTEAQRGPMGAVTLCCDAAVTLACEICKAHSSSCRRASAHCFLGRFLPKLRRCQKHRRLFVQSSLAVNPGVVSMPPSRMAEGRESPRHRRQQRLCVGPLPVAPVNEADTVLLPDGLNALKRVARLTGLKIDGSYLNLDGGFDSRRPQGGLQRRAGSQHQGKPPQSDDPEARAQAVVQCRHPFVTAMRGTHLRVRKQIQAVAVTL
jgi:hypothetical protein